MQRLLTVAVCALAVAACRDQVPTSPGTQPSAAALSSAPSAVDPALSQALASAGATDQLIVIVNYDEVTATSDGVASAVLGTGAGVIQFSNLPMVAALATPAQIAAIQGLSGVTSVYANRQLHYLLHETVVSVRADAAHVAGFTGKGVGIAILDSGVDGLHPDLPTVANVKFLANLPDLFTFQGSINKTIKQAPALFVAARNSETSSGHGTHVAGITAGRGTASAGTYAGIAPGANLIGVGTGDVLFIFWILAGFDYIIEHRKDYNIQVVNNSWGSEGAFDPNDPISKATKQVHKAGITVVFAAGNCGEGDDPSLPAASCPPPGDLQLNPYSVAPWVIGVAAGCKLFLPAPDPTISAIHCEDLDDQDAELTASNPRDGVLADFSSRGVPGDRLYHPDITAPGVHLVSTRASTGFTLTLLDANHDLNLTSTCAIAPAANAFYTCASGTSMASPVITGVVALMEEASGGALTPDQVLKVLQKTARPLTGFQEYEVGAGFVDAFAAVQCARSAACRR
jgi:serine protease AprX